jgi:hypothetical protein
MAQKMSVSANYGRGDMQAKNILIFQKVKRAFAPHIKFDF